MVISSERAMRGDRSSVGPPTGADACRDGPVPRLDLLEGQGSDLASLELRQDQRLDEVPVLGDGGRLDVVEHPGPDVDPFLQQRLRP